MSQAQILLPCAGMAGLTAAVWVKLYVDRIGEMRAQRVHPQKLATSEQARSTLMHIGASDNFRNLFELPVLFYALCLGLAVSGLATPLFFDAAWVYVILRAAHSFIHVSYNRVWHRFIVYAVSSLWLFGLWAAFAVKLAEAA
jgi:hypothetical protein